MNVPRYSAIYDSSDSDSENDDIEEIRSLFQIMLEDKDLNYITFNGKKYEYYQTELTKEILFCEKDDINNIDLWAEQRPCDKIRVKKLVDILLDTNDINPIYSIIMHGNIIKLIDGQHRMKAEKKYHKKLSKNDKEENFKKKLYFNVYVPICNLNDINETFDYENNLFKTINDIKPLDNYEADNIASKIIRNMKKEYPTIITHKDRTVRPRISEKKLYRQLYNHVKLHEFSLSVYMEKIFKLNDKFREMEIQDLQNLAHQKRLEIQKNGTKINKRSVDIKIMKYFEAKNNSTTNYFMLGIVPLEIWISILKN